MPPDALPTYDRRNGLVVLVLVLASVGLWLGLRPADNASVPAGVARALSADTPLSLRVSGGWLRLAGAVPDEATRRALQQAAAAAFGADRVIDELGVRPDAAAVAWLSGAPHLLAELQKLPDPSGVALHRDRIVLTGSVPAEFHRTAREAQARQWFGRDRPIDNQLAVVAAPAAGAATAIAAAATAPATAAPAAPAAPPSPACQGLSDGVPLAFVPGQAALAPAGQKQLATLKGCLGDSGRWRVAGHTDANGVEARNVELTQQRAQAVKAALVAAGIAPERLEAVGLGSARPLADNSSREGRLRNRRVSFEPL